jgi:hypothetical protein
LFSALAAIKVPQHLWFCIRIASAKGEPRRHPLPKSAKSRKPNLERLPPSSPAARDEGPRLIPLEEKSKEPSRLEHYLELADSALGQSENTQEDEKK